MDLIPGDLSESDIKDWYFEQDEPLVPDDEGVIFDSDYEDVDPFGPSFDMM